MIMVLMGAALGIGSERAAAGWTLVVVMVAIFVRAIRLAKPVAARLTVVVVIGMSILVRATAIALTEPIIARRALIVMISVSVLVRATAIALIKPVPA